MAAARIGSHDDMRVRYMRAVGADESYEADDFVRRMLQVAALTLDYEMAFVMIISEKKQFVMASYGAPQELVDRLQGVPREESICNIPIAMAEFNRGINSIFSVSDCQKDERFKHKPFVSSGEVRSYIGAPIILNEENGFASGTLCLVSSNPAEKNLDDADKRKLLSLSQLVAEQLLTRHHAQIIQKKWQEALAQIVGHSIRNPLHALKGLIEGMKQELEFKKEEEFSDRKTTNRGAGGELLTSFASELNVVEEHLGHVASFVRRVNKVSDDAGAGLPNCSAVFSDENLFTLVRDIAAWVELQKCVHGIELVIQGDDQIARLTKFPCCDAPKLAIMLENVLNRIIVLSRETDGKVCFTNINPENAATNTNVKICLDVALAASGCAKITFHTSRSVELAAGPFQNLASIVKEIGGTLNVSQNAVELSILPACA